MYNSFLRDLDDVERECLDVLLDSEKIEVATETVTYVTPPQKAKTFQNWRPNLNCDSAKKILLAHFLTEPGRLNFVSVIQIDLFGVSISNVNECDVHHLPEEQGPHLKKDKKVASKDF